MQCNNSIGCVGSDNKLEKISHSEDISGLGRQVEFPIGSYITFFIRGPPNEDF